ncbi:MAG: hypothetical protein KC776_33045 [Myxococcales bacterium]|nr:hypothetical protein [Myxococcales bacterium]MCB9580432.1 hypothetical protein [Polyangiaceae bacterium]
MSGIELVTEDPAYAFGVLGNLVIAVTREPPSERSVRELARVVGERHATHGDVSLLVAPRAARPTLSQDARRAILSSWEQLEPRITCCAVLFRATGFVGAIQRSLVTAVMNLRKSTLPVRATSLPLEAAEFITRYDASLGAPEPLGTALSEFVSRYEA